jgi:drug/metabolite transporter (DMT)-like permease
MTEAGTHRPQEANFQKNMNGTEKAMPCVQQDDDVLKDTEHPDDARRKTGSIITIVGSALANLSDGYQQNLASSTNVIFNHLLGKEVYTSSRQTRISNALLVGAVIGILIFGYTSDRFSRKGGMLVTSALVVVGSLMATLAFQVNGATHMLWFLTIARGAAGVGVGGQAHQVFPHNFSLTFYRRISHVSCRRSRRLE